MHKTGEPRPRTDTKVLHRLPNEALFEAKVVQFGERRFVVLVPRPTVADIIFEYPPVGKA